MCPIPIKPASQADVYQLRTSLERSTTIYFCHTQCTYCTCTVHVGSYLSLHEPSTERLHAQLSSFCKYMHCIELSSKSSSTLFVIYTQPGAADVRVAVARNTDSQEWQHLTVHSQLTLSSGTYFRIIDHICIARNTLRIASRWCHNTVVRYGFGSRT